MNQLNSGVLSLQFYMAPEALTHLLSPARRLYNFDELAFTRSSVFGEKRHFRFYQRVEDCLS